MNGMAAFIEQGLKAAQGAVLDVRAQAGLHLEPDSVSRRVRARVRGRLKVIETIVRRLIILMAAALDLADRAARQLGEDVHGHGAGLDQIGAEEEIPHAPAVDEGVEAKARREDDGLLGLRHSWRIPAVVRSPQGFSAMAGTRSAWATTPTLQNAIAVDTVQIEAPNMNTNVESRAGIWGTAVVRRNTAKISR